MPGPVPYTDLGGGGPNPPHGEDFFNRIVNVHWPQEGAVTGGVFVAADAYGGIFYLRFGPGALLDPITGDPVWQNVGTFSDPESGNAYIFWGSAYGLVGAAKIPVFVVVGGGGGTHGTGAIFASRDGLGWSKVFTLEQEQPDRNTGANVFAVTWDGSSFWAGGHQSLNRVPGGDNRALEIDILLNSSDGFSWSEAGRHTIVFIPDPPGPSDVYTTGLLEPHCSNLVRDLAYNNRVPGGVFGYDENVKRLIAPTAPPFVDYFFGGVGGGGESGVNVTDFDVGAGGSFSSNPGIPVQGVATAGGAWMAAGGTYSPEGGIGQAAILIPSSVEEHGIGWKRIDPGSKGVFTVCGGQPPVKP